VNLSRRKMEVHVRSTYNTNMGVAFRSTALCTRSRSLEVHVYLTSLMLWHRDIWRHSCCDAGIFYVTRAVTPGYLTSLVLWCRDIWHHSCCDAGIFDVTRAVTPGYLTSLMLWRRDCGNVDDELHGLTVSVNHLFLPLLVEILTPQCVKFVMLIFSAFAFPCPVECHIKRQSCRLSDGKGFWPV